MSDEQSGSLTTRSDDSSFEWNGSTIAVEARMGPKYLFIATEERLTVDGTTVARTGGFKFRDQASGEFVDANGESRGIHYRTGGFFLLKLPFTVSIDGVEVFKGKVRPKGAGWLLVAAITIGFLAGVLV